MIHGIDKECGIPRNLSQTGLERTQLPASPAAIDDHARAARYAAPDHSGIAPQDNNRSRESYAIRHRDLKSSLFAEARERFRKSKPL